MKKLLVGIVLVFLLAACGEETKDIDTSVDQNDEQNQKDENTSGDSANKENNVGDEAADTREETASVVVLDEAGVKITYTGLTITEDAVFGKEAKLNFSIENSTDKLVTVQERNMSVDGYMVDETILTFSEDVAAGKKAKGAITFSEFEGYDFPAFNETIEFDLVVIDGESWENIVQKPVNITVQSGGTADNGQTEEANDNAQVVVDESGVKISYTGLEITEDEIMGKEAHINFMIENNSDKLITVQQRNLSVDDFMVDETILSFSQDVKPGKKAKGSISVSDFEGYDFPEFKENMEFDLVVIDGESWENILQNTVNITIE